MKNLKNYFKGFTLVELIIVITILAILATIAFISFQNYTRDARDANRTATIKNIEKGLELFTIKTGNFPAPDESSTFTGGLDGKVKINQGIVGENVARVINMNTIPLDPKDKTKYTYSTFGDNHKYYQVAINAENNQTSFIPQTYAFTPKSAIVQGNYHFDPSLPSLIVVPSSVNTASGIFDPKVCFVVDGGKNSLSSSSGSCIEKEDMSLKDFDSSLVGYWDMESGTGNILYDLSGNGNNGTGSGGIVVGGTGGMNGKATYFDGNNDFIEILDNTSIREFNKGITISTIVKMDVRNLGAVIISKEGTGDTNTYRQENWNIFIRTSAKQITTFLINRKQNVSNLNDCGVTNPVITGKYGCWLYPTRDYDFDNGMFLKYTFTYDINSGLGIIYLNGQKYAEQTFLNNELLSIEDKKVRNALGNLFIGYIKSSNIFYDGIIDEVKIYNRALTDEEIGQQAKIAGFN